MRDSVLLIPPSPLHHYFFSSLVQNLVQLIDDLVTENAELQQQLTRKEAELTRAEETIRRDQHQIRQLVHTCTSVSGSGGGGTNYQELR